MLYELAKVLRYPRMLALHGLSEGRIFDYVGSLREAMEIVRTNPLLITPIRDVNDTVVIILGLGFGRRAHLYYKTVALQINITTVL